jgi:hypothetical protein
MSLDSDWVSLEIAKTKHFEYIDDTERDAFRSYVHDKWPISTDLRGGFERTYWNRLPSFAFTITLAIKIPGFPLSWFQKTLVEGD